VGDYSDTKLEVICDVAGGSGDSRFVKPLINSIDESDMDANGYISEALGRIGDPEGSAPLVSIAYMSDSTYKIEIVEEALGKIGDCNSLKLLIGKRDEWLERCFKKYQEYDGQDLNEVCEDEDPLENMQSAWQDWYKGQQSVPAEEEEVFLRKEDVVRTHVEDDAEEISITKRDAVTQPEVVEEEVEETQSAAVEEKSVPSPLPAQRSWAGTGLVLAVVVTLLFIGTVTVTAGYVLTRNMDDSPVANIYTGVQDYFLGIQ